MEQPALTTRRLLLRKFDQGDSADVRRLAGNYNVARTTLTIPYPYKAGMAEEWIATHQDAWDTRTCIVYAMTLLDSGSLIGAISLANIDKVPAELGYWVCESCWGRGYCTEAANRLIDYAFVNLGLTSIVAIHLATNPASGRVMKKAGMQYSRSEKKLGRHNNEVDVDVCEIQNKQE